MSDYIFGSNLSYRDYLQAKNFEDDVRSDISKQTRSIIASNEELQREHIQVLQASSEAMSTGLEQLSYDMNSLSEEVRKLGAAFEWGFSQLLLETARINDTLAGLLKIAKTPAQTWAYEQFEIARDAFRRELYDDALEYLNRAINGYSGNTGYTLEYRFHYLLGTIRMGSFKNISPEIVNLDQAEQAFLSAAKYAKADYPGQMRLSYLAAGWAAYCQGKIAEAERHTDLALGTPLPIMHFQMAKIRAHKRDSGPALASLRKAIEGDRGYSLKAASDADFQPYKGEVDRLIGTLREEARTKAEAALAEASREVANIESRRVEKINISDYPKFHHAKEALENAASAMRNKTYYGYLDVLWFCERTKTHLTEALSKFQEDAKHAVWDLKWDLDKKIKEARAYSMDGGWGCIWSGLMAVGMIVSFMMACVQCSNVQDMRARQDPRGAEVRRWYAEIRARGINPNALDVDQFRRLGYRLEDLPSQFAGYTGPAPSNTWFSYFLIGAFLSILVGSIGFSVQKSRILARLESERARLQLIESGIGSSA